MARSANGGYYTCDFTTAAGSSQCVFGLTCSAPAEWLALGAVEHNMAPSPCGHNQGGATCEIQNATGTSLSLSPKPWQNGDDIKVVTTAQTGTPGTSYDRVTLRQ